MHVIAKKPLKEFWVKHPDSKKPLEAWFRTIERSTFRTWSELKATFPTADKIGDRIVFNIGGNKYRLITVMHFNRGKVFVRYGLKHKEYDEGRCKHG